MPDLYMTEVPDVATSLSDTDLMLITGDMGEIDPLSKIITWANIKASIRTYLDTIYPLLSFIHDATSKTTPVDSDEIPLADSASSFSIKKLNWSNFKASLKTYFDTLYSPYGSLAGNWNDNGWSESTLSWSWVSGIQRSIFSQNATSSALHGSSSLIKMTDTSGFLVGDKVLVQPNNEEVSISAIVANTSVTFDSLTNDLVRNSSVIAEITLTRAGTGVNTSGANKTITMANTSGFSVGDWVLVTSGSSKSITVIKSLTTNTNIIVSYLAYDVTDPSITLIPTSSRAYTNNPSTGSNIVLNIVDTSVFSVGDYVTVSSSIGFENTIIDSIVTNVSITVRYLGYDHTLTNPIVTKMNAIPFTNDLNYGSSVVINVGSTSGITASDTILICSFDSWITFGAFSKIQVFKISTATVSSVVTNTSVTVSSLDVSHLKNTVTVTSTGDVVHPFTSVSSNRGYGITLNVSNTSGFNVGDNVIVSSSAGSDTTTILSIVANTSVTFEFLNYVHTLTTPLITRKVTKEFVANSDDDQTGFINVGDKVKITQDSATKYFIVTNVGAYSGGVTPITLYGGTDNVLTSSTIYSPFYSHIRSPLGFRLNDSEWGNILYGTDFVKSGKLI